MPLLGCAFSLAPPATLLPSLHRDVGAPSSLVLGPIPRTSLPSPLQRLPCKKRDDAYRRRDSRIFASPRPPLARRAARVWTTNGRTGHMRPHMAARRRTRVGHGQQLPEKGRSRAATPHTSTCKRSMRAQTDASSAAFLFLHVREWHVAITAHSPTHAFVKKQGCNVRTSSPLCRNARIRGC